MMSDDLPRPPGMPPIDQEPGGKPEWDQDAADWLVGKYALVGITYLAADGQTEKSRVQYHGRIVSAEQDKGFTIACEGKWAGKTMCLPPMPSAFRLAKAGNYSLYSTGEVVEDPDVVVTWTITEPSKS
jgi:hypothetical protein